MSSTVTLSHDQLRELAVMIAQELAAKPAQTRSPFGSAELSNSSPSLVGVAAVARALGVSEWFVREHADELGVVRVGSGSKKRLRFDLDVVVSRYMSESSQPSKPSVGGGLASGRSRSAARRPIVGRNEGRVLRIRGEAR